MKEEEKKPQKQIISPTGGDREVHHSPGFKVMRQPCRQDDGAQAREGRAETKRETVQRQTSSCSGQARLTGGAGRDGFFLFVFLNISAGEVTQRRRASLVPNFRAGPQRRATSERHTHTGVDMAGVC